MKLEMERTGQFAVNFTANATRQCGVPDNFVLHYRVLLETTDRHLDGNGFVIDNNAVHAYFSQTYKWVSHFESCENIAIDACNHFKREIPNLKKVAVSISGNPNAAWLTSSWSRSQKG